MKLTVTDDTRIQTGLVERTGWPPGRWDEEPDRITWTHQLTGLRCIMLRRNRYGHWCGYVGVPPGHPWYAKHYDAVHEAAGWANLPGELTYAEPCDGKPDTGVCHPGDGGKPTWWLGMDYAHHTDVAPGLIAGRLRLLAEHHADLYGGATYKTVAYVQDDVVELAKAVAAAGTPWRRLLYAVARFAPRRWGAWLRRGGRS